MTEEKPTTEFERRSATSKRNWANPETRQRQIKAIKKGLARHKKTLARPKVRKEREEAAQIALQTVHDCVECRKVLYELALINPAKIEIYKKHVEAALADPTISIQGKKLCQCCHLAQVAGTHGNSKLCIPCKVVREEKNKRDKCRQYRSRQRGDVPVEEVRQCAACPAQLTPDPETGKIHGSTKYCPACAEERNYDGRLTWKKNQRAEARAEAGRYCRGLKIVKIDEDEWIRECGLWFVPEKSMHQEFCSDECTARTEGIRNSVNPERREYYKNYATRLRERAWRPADWEDWDAEQKAVGIILIENPGIKPRALGILLDQSRLPCIWQHNGGSWERNFAESGTGRNWLNRLTKRLDGNPLLTK